MQYMLGNITQSNKCNLAGKNNLKIPFVINLLELINDQNQILAMPKKAVVTAGIDYLVRLRALLFYTKWCITFEQSECTLASFYT